MDRKHLAGMILFCSLVSAVPSRAAFHPIGSLGAVGEDDLTGSGREVDDRGVTPQGAAREDVTQQKVAREWRDLAQRVRRLAALLPEADRQQALDLAATYEARAERLEAAKTRS